MSSDKKSNFSFGILFLMVLMVSIGCKKNNIDALPVFDSAKQAIKDDSLLVDYFKTNGLTDLVTKTSSGLYYRITKPVSGNMLIVAKDVVFTRYELRLLNETLIEENVTSATAFKFNPEISNVIKAWKEGILLFRNGEEGYLYCPSGLGYGNTIQGKIPASTCLKFLIRVTNVE